MKKRIRFVSVLLAVMMLFITTNYAIGDETETYPITCVNCIAQDNIFMEITSAHPGDTVNLAFEYQSIPKDKYYSSDNGFVSDDVTVKKGQYSWYFTMPAKAVKVSANLLDRETAVVDLSEKDIVECNFVLMDSVVEVNQTAAFENTGGKGDFGFDLNNDGKKDITITLDPDNHKASVKRESGSDKITKPVTLTMNDEYYYYRKYKACTFKVSRSAKVETFSLSFNSNGGTGTMKAVTGEKGKSFTLPKNVFTKKDCIFKAWNTKKNGSGTSYANCAKISLTKNLTLYAQWAKISLKIKKPTIKASAKKLQLQVTLKIDGKPVKGKKVTVIFNGKTYTKKTDSKGIAKVTIKKSVLKKLKLGSKVTIEASYEGTTAKKSVKVKK